MKITTKELTPELWPELETLFKPNGACGGCWCQAWRIEKGEKMAEIQGAKAMARLREGVLTGDVLGVLAFVDGAPVGWCTFGPRETFPRLNRARTLKCDDMKLVWSIPCFYVARGFREKGISTAMLKHVLKILKVRGVKIAEGYPSKPDKQGKYIPTFAWTGTRSLFGKAGFTVAGNPNGSKQRVRKIINP